MADTPTPARAESDAERLGKKLWTDLCEKDDRTSPEEYPDMALITQDELCSVVAAAFDERDAKFAAQAGEIERRQKELVAGRVRISELETQLVELASAIREPEDRRDLLPDFIESVIAELERADRDFRSGDAITWEGLLNLLRAIETARLRAPSADEDATAAAREIVGKIGWHARADQDFDAATAIAAAAIAAAKAQAYGRAKQIAIKHQDYATAWAISALATPTGGGEK